MKYGKLFAENVHDVTMTSSPVRILSNSNTNLPRAYLSNKLNFILIEHKRTEIQSREVNRELRRNKKHSENADTSTSVTFDLVV